MPTVLIVDDNKNNLQVLGSILGENGYKVALSINGTNVPHLIEKVWPDLIILDIMMPVMDGFEVCIKLKENPAYRDIPVIFLTAKSDIDSITEGFRVGGVDYITKPFRREELLARVRTHLELVNSRRLIEEQARQLEALNQLKNKIFTAVSNDLTGSLKTFAELFNLMNDPRVELEKEELNELLGELKKKSEFASGLLENLLWWSKSQRQLLHPKISKFKLAALLEETEKSLSGKLASKNIGIRLSGDRQLEAIGDTAQLELVFKNLIDNAIKFSGHKQEIEIQLKESANAVIVEITDHGTGMDEDTLRSVLDKYEFFTQPGTNNEKGTGIGLLLCQEILEANQASMTINSVIDQGTTVTVNLAPDL